MGKPVPKDCKRITPSHLRGLDAAALGLIAQRIETQTQALNRARRLVGDAMAELDDA